MNAAAPEGTPPRRIRNLPLRKLPCPAVPRRGPEAGNSPNAQYCFSGETSSNKRVLVRVIDSCFFIPSKDDPRRPRRDAPAADQKLTFKETSLPRHASERP